MKNHSAQRPMQQQLRLHMTTHEFYATKLHTVAGFMAGSSWSKLVSIKFQMMWQEDGQ
jgi:hypothetical protein